MVVGTSYVSKTSLVMYSLGMRGSWCENTFCNPTSQISVCRDGWRVTEFPITWNSMTPRLSSFRAASSRAEWAAKRLPYDKLPKKREVNFVEFYLTDKFKRLLRISSILWINKGVQLPNFTTDCLLSNRFLGYYVWNKIATLRHEIRIDHMTLWCSSLTLSFLFFEPINAQWLSLSVVYWPLDRPWQLGPSLWRALHSACYLGCLQLTQKQTSDTMIHFIAYNTCTMRLNNTWK